MRPLSSSAQPPKLFGAGGRPLFAVHRERCAEVVEAGCYVGTVALLAAAREQLADRAPVLSAIVERYAASRRGELETGATQ